MNKSKNVQKHTKAGNEVLDDVMPCFSDWDFAYEFEMWQIISQEGKHDDHVITSALGAWACNNYMDTPKPIATDGKRKSGRAVSEATF